MEALATAQDGVVHRTQLTALAATEAHVAHWIHNGWLLRQHEGVYAVGHQPRGRGAAFRAAVLAGGPGAALSHASAAAHLRLRPSGAAVVDVMVLRGGERERDGIRFHRPRIYDPQRDATLVDGIVCTTVARTLVDLASVLRLEPLELAVKQAEILGLLDLRAIADVLSRITRPRGVRNLRRCLGAERLDGSLARSRMERRFLRLCRDAGLPRPLVNQRIEVRPGEWPTVDFYWPSARLAIETDGWATHGNPIAARRDRRRDRDLRQVGVRVERFMWDDLIATPEEIVAFLASLLVEGRQTTPERP